DGAYSAPNPEPGSLTLDPVAERTNFSNNSFPLKSRERVDSHGLGGINAARRMHCIRENKK
ncbi:MAG: hypothetical protein PUE61_00540, partial [Clostridiales bacterium]|nr:hypothetical protein [Clostridiales bacterium]